MGLAHAVKSRSQSRPLSKTGRFGKNCRAGGKRRRSLFQKCIALPQIRYQDLTFCVLELGKIHGRAGRHSEAIDALLAGIARDPTHSAINRNIGIAYANTGKRAKALAHWSVSLNVEPNQAKLRRDFMQLLQQWQRGRPPR